MAQYSFFWGHIIFILILHRYVWSSILCFVYDRNIYKYLSAFSSIILKVTCTAKVCQPDSPQHRQLWWGSTPTWIWKLQAMTNIRRYVYSWKERFDLQAVFRYSSILENQFTWAGLPLPLFFLPFKIFDATLWFLFVVWLSLVQEQTEQVNSDTIDLHFENLGFDWIWERCVWMIKFIRLT